jgi:acyl carrier protein
MGTIRVTPQVVEQAIAEALPQFGVEPSQISSDATFEQLNIDSLDLVVNRAG